MRGTLIERQNFGGGVNVQAAAFNLAPEEARYARNVVPTARGSIRKRDGCQAFSTPSQILHSLYPMQGPNYLLGVGGTSLYRVATDGSVSTFAAGLLTASQRWEWVQAPANGGQGPVYGGNGVDTPRYFTGTASSTWTATSGSIPNGKYFLWRANRVWIAGVSAAPSRLYFSDIDPVTGPNPRYYPTDNYVDFDPDDGEAISGIGSFGPYLLVFKPSKAWVVYDLDSGNNRRLGANVGCIAHRSIVETPDGTMFLSKDQGVMVTDGQSVKRVGDRIKPLTDTFATAQWGAITAEYFDRHYYLSGSVGGAYNDLIVDLDMVLDSWWVHNNPVQDFAVWTPSTSPQLYGARGDTAAVQRLYVPGVYQDSGANYEAYWRHRFETFDQPSLKKRVRAVAVDGSGHVKVLVAKDFQMGDTLLEDKAFATDNSGSFGVNDGGSFGVDDGSSYGGGVVLGQIRHYTLGTGRAWSLAFSNNTNDTFEIEAFSYAIQLKKN